MKCGAKQVPHPLSSWCVGFPPCISSLTRAGASESTLWMWPADSYGRLEIWAWTRSFPAPTRGLSLCLPFAKDSDVPGWLLVRFAWWETGCAFCSQIHSTFGVGRDLQESSPALKWMDQMGVEPTTSGLSAPCSDLLSVPAHERVQLGTFLAARASTCISTASENMELFS